MKYKRFIAMAGICFLLGISAMTSAQKTDAFARVSISPREGVVRQPFKVTINVYSSTWFAKPLQFTNLRIDNAFILPFTNTVSGINYINRKKYATLTFYYLVFPYNTGSLEVPELAIEASIPPEGEYQGQPVSIRTKAQTIKVKAVPSSEEQPVWMVAKNISVKENWSHSLQALKVGDVVEREIVIDAEGTLPSLIQPLEIEKPEATSIYPQQAELKDKRNNRDANGERTERYSYLFEEEGEVIIPEEEIVWWDPVTKRSYKRTIAAQTISIAPNPDLAMMESLKDSLMALNPQPEVEEAEEKATPWKEIIIFIVLLALTIHFCSKAFKLLVQYIRDKRKYRLESEAHYFKQVKKALDGKDSSAFIRALYSWFDKTRKPWQSAAIYDYLNDEEASVLEDMHRNKESKMSTAQSAAMRPVLKSLRTALLVDPTVEQQQMMLNKV